MTFWMFADKHFNEIAGSVVAVAGMVFWYFMFRD